jgi:sporulation protein YlmC with PRC-barrel domain
MDIPVDVDVKCAGELCGRSKYLVVNPVKDRITHLVVAEKDYPHIERLVPVDQIIESKPDEINLRCTQNKLFQMESFVETDFIGGDRLEPTLPYNATYQFWPYTMYEATPMPIEREKIPAGEILIRRGTMVEATDGSVGRVDEFLVDPRNDSISHLVLREGHLWGEKDVTIPISEVEMITGDTVKLKLSKKEVGQLPSIQVKHWWN